MTSFFMTKAWAFFALATSFICLSACGGAPENSSDVNFTSEIQKPFVMGLRLKDSSFGDLVITEIPGWSPNKFVSNANGQASITLSVGDRISHYAYSHPRNLKQISEWSDFGPETVLRNMSDWDQKTNFLRDSGVEIGTHYIGLISTDGTKRAVTVRFVSAASVQSSQSHAQPNLEANKPLAEANKPLAEASKPVPTPVPSAAQHAGEVVSTINGKLSYDCKISLKQVIPGSGTAYTAYMSLQGANAQSANVTFRSDSSRSSFSEANYWHSEFAANVKNLASDSWIRGCDFAIK